MGVIRNIAIAVLAISALVFIALFGRLPVLRNTPVGFINRLLLTHIPKHVHALDERLTGGRLSARGARLGNYLFYANHPLIMITYLTILTAAIALFVSSAWPRIAWHHHVIIPLLAFWPYLLTYICNRASDAITPASYDAARALYPFDHAIFHPGTICYTCKWEKPARSKHCSMCGVCVTRYDHHCMWVANCVGANNYKYFVALMLSLAVLLSYGVYLAYTLLIDDVRASRRAHWPAAWADAIQADIRVGSTGLLALLTGPLAWALFAYHVYLVWAGMTTSETSKWQEMRLDMRDGLVWLGKRREADAYANCKRWPIITDQIIIRQNEPEPPTFTRAVDGQPIEGWTQLHRLREVQNLYDLGFADNLLDAMGWL